MDTTNRFWILDEYKRKLKHEKKNNIDPFDSFVDGFDSISIARIIGFI